MAFDDVVGAIVCGGVLFVVPCADAFPFGINSRPIFFDE